MKDALDFNYINMCPSFFFYSLPQITQMTAQNS